MNILGTMNRPQDTQSVMTRQIGRAETDSGRPIPAAPNPLQVMQRSAAASKPRAPMPDPTQAISTPTAPTSSPLQAMTGNFSISGSNLPKMIQPATLDDRKPKNVYTSPPPTQAVQPGRVAEAQVVPGQPTRAAGYDGPLTAAPAMPGTIDSAPKQYMGPQYPVYTPDLTPIIIQPDPVPVVSDTVPIRSGISEELALEIAETEVPVLSRPGPTKQEPAVVTGNRPTPAMTVEPVRVLEKIPVMFGGTTILEPAPIIPTASKGLTALKTPISKSPDVVTAPPIQSKAAAIAELSTVGIVSDTDPIVGVPSAVDPVPGIPQPAGPTGFTPVYPATQQRPVRPTSAAQQMATGYKIGAKEAAVAGGMGLLLLL